MKGPLDGLLGIYEKSLPAARSWDEMFVLARATGYDFFELSVDETPQRGNRLTWSGTERAAVRRAAEGAGLRVGTIALSAQRSVPMGSRDPDRRRRSIELAERAIGLAADLEAPFVQIAGYFTFYEPHHKSARQFFLEGLAKAAVLAEQQGVRLAIENVDGTDITTVANGLQVLRDIGHPNVGLYVDVGNLVGNGRNAVSELTLAAEKMVAVQLKDARRGAFRRVPFGEGEVDFAAVFRRLGELNYHGPLSVEMWNDQDDQDLAAEARAYLASQGLDRWRTDSSADEAVAH